MHRTFARQLRRNCNIESAEALQQQLAALNALQLPPELAAFVGGLGDLFGRVQSTYEENERDLNLRSRSLEESSAELSAINDRMRIEIASRNRVLKSVRDAAGKLLEPGGARSNATSNPPLPGEADLEGLSALLPDLVAQQEKRRLELLNQRFAMDQHAIVSMTDTIGVIFYVNDKFCRISGYAREELVGKTHSILNSGIHPQAFFTEFWDTIRAGKVWHGEFCNASREGVLYWEDCSVVPFLDETGRPYQYISICTDITERKRMAEKIEASEKQYRALVESVRDVIFQINEMGNWCFLNPVWEEVTGFSIPDTINKSFLEYVHHDDFNKAQNMLVRLRDSVTDNDRLELRFFDNRNGYCWFEVTIQRELDECTQMILFTGTLNDITERRRIAQLQSEFVSVVSHELRTPITSIRGALALLDAGTAGPIAPSQLKLVQIAHKNSQRLVTLVNDILDMEKLMAGKMTMKIEHLNLTALIESSIEANTAYAQGLQVQFDFTAPAQDAIAMFDSNRVMQVMANLLSNAAKFSPREMAVKIRMLDEDERWKVQVCDRGPGIPLEFRSRIFSAFAQANSSDTRQQGGTGLGLKISKALIEMMGGEIGFDSEPGQGTCFWFTLPKGSALAEQQEEFWDESGESGL